MMFERNLDWRKFAENYGEDYKRILLGLSSKKWLWRTFDNLLAVTKLDHDTLTHGLAELIEDGMVTGSINRRTGAPIFGLSERVGLRTSRRSSRGLFEKFSNRDTVEQKQQMS